ncbi:MAG: 3'-5' exonuclease [Terricaulis sp.]
MHKLWYALDVEGDGAQPPNVIELALVELAGFELTGRCHHWRIKPPGKITPRVTQIHGITDDDVANAPDFEDIAGDVLELLEDAAILGHNVRVDLDALTRPLPDWRPLHAYDTMRLARICNPGLKSYALTNLAAALALQAKAAAISGSSAHNAPYDAVMAALLMQRLFDGVAVDERAILLARSDILAPDAQGSLF